MKEINYINLTNGIEAIEKHNLKDYRFIRIQSTSCEQKRWDYILLTLSDDFLINLALGNKCFVYDFGANKKCPRAIYQGLEFIKLVLYKRWFDRDYDFEICTNMNRDKKYYIGKMRNLDRGTKRKVDYFKKFLMTDKLNIETIFSSTDKDNNNEYYFNILKK